MTTPFSPETLPDGRCRIWVIIADAGPAWCLAVSLLDLEARQNGLSASTLAGARCWPMFPFALASGRSACARGQRSPLPMEPSIELAADGAVANYAISAAGAAPPTGSPTAMVMT